MGGGPAVSLDGAAGFEGQTVIGKFPVVVGDFFFEHEAAEIAVGGDDVEAVIVNAEMGEMRGHLIGDGAAGEVEEATIAGGVEDEQCGAELEAVGPMGPGAGGVLSGGGEAARALASRGGGEIHDLAHGQGHEAVDGGEQIGGLDSAIQRHGR